MQGCGCATCVHVAAVGIRVVGTQHLRCTQMISKVIHAVKATLLKLPDDTVQVEWGEKEVGTG